MTKDKKVTHGMLVRAARIWLSTFCRVVVAEMSVASVPEIPDAMGWKWNGESWLVECKTSRSDFFADQKKSHRRQWGMGAHRVYLAPVGLIKEENLPDGWGLIEYQQSRHDRGYFLKRGLVNRIGGRSVEDWAACQLTQKEEKAFLIGAAYRALEAMRLVKPLNIGSGKATEAIEARIAELAIERDTHDQRRREAMGSVEEWRLKCWALRDQLAEIDKILLGPQAEGKPRDTLGTIKRLLLEGRWFPLGGGE
jgi:hypothetical protein